MWRRGHPRPEAWAVVSCPLWSRTGKVSIVHDTSGQTSLTQTTGVCPRRLHGIGHPMPGELAEPARGLSPAPCAEPRPQTQTATDLPACLPASAGQPSDSREVLLPVAVRGSPGRPCRCVSCGAQSLFLSQEPAGSGPFGFVAVACVSPMLYGQKRAGQPLCLALAVRKFCRTCSGPAAALPGQDFLELQGCPSLHVPESEAQWHPRLGVSGPVHLQPLCSSWRPSLRSPSARSP